MNRGRPRSGWSPSNPPSGRSWRPVGSPRAAYGAKASPVSSAESIDHKLTQHGSPAEGEVSNLTADMNRLQILNSQMIMGPDDHAFTMNADKPICTDDLTSSGSSYCNKGRSTRGLNADEPFCTDDLTSPGSSYCDKGRSTRGLNADKPSRTDDLTSPGSSYSDKGRSTRDLRSPASGNSGDRSSEQQSAVVKPFDICLFRPETPGLLKPSLLSKNREKRNQMKALMEETCGLMCRPGMVHLKSYLSIDEQVKLVKVCRDLGLGSGGFYQPGYRDGAKLNLKMMCLGKNWDPETSSYGEERPIDGARPPRIPDEFNQIVERVIRDCHAVIKKNTGKGNVEGVLPWMTPNICLVNFYTSSGRLGLHQDRDESEASLRKGLPVVSFSIGDAAEFLYGDQRDVDKAEKILLESGDVLVFGGKSRHIFHGVPAIRSKTAPQTLLDETKLRPGRLNLTFREY